MVFGTVPAAPSMVETRLVHLKATGQDHGATDDTYRRVGVDPVKPGEVTNIQSSSHYNAIGQWNDPQSRDNTVTVTWTAASDGFPEFGSGVDGYSITWDEQANTLPDKTKDIEEGVTSVTSPVLADGNDWYFHIRSVDNVGNWDQTAAHIGPFYIDTTLPIAAFTHSVSGLTVNFDASGSTDATSGIDRYEWNFGDSTGSGVSPSHTYSAAGTYTVTLRVWDKAGNDGTGTAIVSHSVNPVPEFPLGIELMIAIAPAIPIVYLWRTRKNKSKTACM